MERKFVVIRRALGNTAFTTSNRLDEMNNLYGVSIKSVISPFTDRYGNGYITGLDEAGMRERNGLSFTLENSPASSSVCATASNDLRRISSKYAATICNTTDF